MRIVPVIALLLAAPAAWADESLPPVASELAQKECGSCHMAYQPQLLPAEAWTRLFDGLADHFGNDASLEEPVRQEILAYYVAHAGRPTGEAASLRITEAPWWVREHREVRAATWARPEIKFKGNCVACHRQAEQGNYED